MPDTFQPDAALHPLLSAEDQQRFGIMPPHQRFTVSGTAYMRTLSRQDLNDEAWVAVHYQRPPRKTGGGTSISLRFPIMIVAGLVEDQQAVAEQVARILNEHWRDDDD